METANTQILDASIKHSVGLQRYSAGVVKQIIALLNKVDDDLVKQILKLDPTAVSGSYSRARLEKLLEAVRAVNGEAYAAVKKELTGELKGLAAHEADFQARMITSSIPIQMDIVKPSASQLYASVKARPFQGRFLAQWFDGLEQGAQQRVASAIQIGFVEGEGIEAIIRRVRGSRSQQYRDGALEINRRSAQMVVRTAINHTANVARQETYKQNEGVIKGWQFVATLDSRTCFVAGTQVLTPIGLRAIEELQPGDDVIGGSRDVRKVEGTAKSSRNLMARVTLSNGEELVCTADHMFLTNNGEWKDAQDLTVGESLASVL